MKLPGKIEKCLLLSLQHCCEVIYVSLHLSDFLFSAQSNSNNAESTEIMTSDNCFTFTWTFDLNFWLELLLIPYIYYICIHFDNVVCIWLPIYHLQKVVVSTAQICISNLWCAMMFHASLVLLWSSATHTWFKCIVNDDAKDYFEG